jgi:uncharacterized membrane protein
LRNEVAAGQDGNLNAQVPPQPAPNVISAAGDPPADAANPCLMQGANRLENEPIRALGTEPFWGAAVTGRCVTYSTPENQQGVRVWTRYSEGSNRTGKWLGQLNGQEFEMRVRQEAGCTDGMSDRRFPMAVELAVNGQTRKGCAEPL